VDNYLIELDQKKWKPLTRTQQKLKTAILELYAKEGLEKINVRELCSRACVARTSFYNYYDNTTQLMEELEDRLLSDMRRNAAPVTHEEFATEESISLLQGYLDFIRQNEDIFRIFLVTRPNYRFIQKWERSTIEHLDRRLKNSNTAIHNRELALQLSASSTVTAFTYGLQHPEKVDDKSLRNLVVRYFRFLESL
jgi:AcrR family transcriptional regulator